MERGIAIDQGTGRSVASDSRSVASGSRSVASGSRSVASGSRSVASDSLSVASDSLSVPSERGSAGPTQVGLQGTGSIPMHNGGLAPPGAIQALIQDRETLLRELRSSSHLHPSINRLLASAQMSRLVEESARVFRDARTNGEAIDIRKIEDRFGQETRLLVIVLIQHGLIKSLRGLSREFEQRVREFLPAFTFSMESLGMVTSSVPRLDGQWSDDSRRLSDDVAELMYRLVHFENGRAVAPARTDDGDLAGIGSFMLGVIRWFSPHHAAFMVPVEGNSEAGQEFRTLRVSGRQDAGLPNRRTSGISFTQRMTPHGRATPEFVKKAM